MATLAANQVAVEYINGTADRAVLYAIRNATTADIVDCSAEFTRVKQAMFLGATVNGTATGTISGTNVTVPSGLTNDAAWLLAWGCANG
jgi:hypothetical protein